MAEPINSKVPKIRFKGFAGEWEEKTLGDLGAFKNGMNFGKEAMGHGNPFVNLQNVFGQFVVDDQKLELAVSSAVQRREYNLLKGDVLFIRSSVKPEGVGETALVTKTLIDTTYSGFIIRYRPEVLMSDDFNRIVYRTSLVRKQILASASRSANTNINQKALQRIEIQIPDFSEQTQIGTYFRELDRLIELHQRKYDKLVTLKKAMLQKMFPQPGATTPEIRFKGFEGEWVEKKLGDVTSLQTGHPFEGKKFVKEGVLLIRGMNVKRGNLDTSKAASEYWPSVLGYENFLLEEDDIVIQMDGALIGKSYAKIEKENLPALLVQRVTRVRCAVVNCDFIYQYIQKDFLGYIRSTKTETAVPHLSLNDIRDFSVVLPDKAEQQKIGTYFRTLDALIAKHAIQLAKLKQIKSACLDKMFV